MDLAPVEAGAAQGFRRAERPGSQFLAKGVEPFAVGGSFASALALDGWRQAIVGAWRASAWAPFGIW